ncbi:alpha/beta hydrolase [Rhodococcus sp. ARC_M12]|uniref:serine aminopeptidase domain-containing protein n=1 Tax=Rhodococcus sp. ARC_M12 TaxID=2928854 RepID=UPI001FB1DFF8|nr:alpha/beta hydrolase [Rhodococcus sp. ARC_M12]MCJ0977441.1 alpha/beta hydrolase [Rhodococcus sp. ARC_M12]
MAGKIWGALHRAPSGARTAALIVHPTSNFMGHYLLETLASRGIDAVGLATRYVGNDSTLTMENCVLDVGAAVRHLRERGYDKVVLIGNSGGGGLAAMYQSQAENPTITATPAGDPPDLTRADLPPVDGVLQLMAHPGRAQVLTDWIDPAVVDENDPFKRDEDLDLFSGRFAPPFDRDYLVRYRDAQTARNRRITRWVREQLAELSRQGGKLQDLPFVVHGTTADPRFLDVTVDPSDRQPGTMWGPTQVANMMPASLAHYSSLRSWLSQWSIDDSNCDGNEHISRITVPTLIMYGTADQVCFPSYATGMFDAVQHENKQLTAVEQGLHYLSGQPEKVAFVGDTVAAWLRDHELAC